jgi:hypothetical protein
MCDSVDILYIKSSTEQILADEVSYLRVIDGSQKWDYVSMLIFIVLSHFIHDLWYRGFM